MTQLFCLTSKESTQYPEKDEKLTNIGPISHRCAIGAKVNHKIIPNHAFKLIEKIAINRKSVDDKKDDRQIFYSLSV